MKIITLVILFHVCVIINGCAALTNLNSARVLDPGQLTATMGLFKINGYDDNFNQMMDAAGRVGLVKNIDVGIKCDFTNYNEVDTRLQILRNPLLCNIGLGIGFTMNGTSHLYNFSREFIYEPNITIGQDWWYYTFCVYHPSITENFKKDIIFKQGEFSAWHMSLGGIIKITKEASIIIEVNYWNSKSGGKLWVPAVGLQNSI